MNTAYGEVKIPISLTVATDDSYEHVPLTRIDAKICDNGELDILAVSSLSSLPEVLIYSSAGELLDTEEMKPEDLPFIVKQETIGRVAIDLTEAWEQRDSTEALTKDLDAAYADLEEAKAELEELGEKFEEEKKKLMAQLEEKNIELESIKCTVRGFTNSVDGMLRVTYKEEDDKPSHCYFKVGDRVTPKPTLENCYYGGLSNVKGRVGEIIDIDRREGRGWVDLKINFPNAENFTLTDREVLKVY